MAIVIVPPYPQRNDPNFATVADSWNAQLPTWTDQVNATAVDVTSKANTATTQAGIATTQAGAAATQATNASNSASQAAASAQTAINAPGTSATSTTSLTIGTGSKTLTIQTGKSIVTGMYLMVAKTSSPSNFIIGQVTSYNSTTGSLTINGEVSSGTGTYTDWTISLTGKPSTYVAATQEEMEIGTETSIRSVSPKLIADAINIRVREPHYITSSQAWVVPSRITQIFVQLVGGGGAGDGQTSSGISNGGCAGGYSEKLITVTPGDSISITIGAGGVAVSGGSGGAGGTTSFGSHFSATGGSPTSRGTGVSGNLNLFGGKSMAILDMDSGSISRGISMGGASFFGQGAVLSRTDSAFGNSAENYGSGGSGSFAKTPISLGGGAGAPGLVIIWY